MCSIRTYSATRKASSKFLRRSSGLRESYSKASGRKWWIRAQNARPLLQLVEKLSIWMFCNRHKRIMCMWNHTVLNAIRFLTDLSILIIMQEHHNDWQCFLMCLQSLNHYILCNQSVFMTHCFIIHTFQMSFLLLFLYNTEYSSNDKNLIL